LFGKGTVVKDRKDDRRSRRSRRLIADALLALMREKRYDRITVREILERADVGRTTFYAQFRGKDDVLASEFGRILGLLHERHLAATDQPGDQFIPGLSLFRHIQEQRPLYEALVRGDAFDQHRRAVHRHLRDHVLRQLALATGSPDLAVPPEIVADYLVGTLLTLVHRWLEHGMPYTPEQMEMFFERLALPGVRAVLQRAPGER
jgi:AcrR family transcriptional regulator